SISTYLGNVHSALHDFNELLPPAASSTTEQEKEREQRSTFFMPLALYGLPEEYSAIRDQILGSATVPDMSTASAILLRVPAKHSLEHHSSIVTNPTMILIIVGCCMANLIDVGWCQSNKDSGSTASVAHTGNSSVCLSQSSLGPWVLDSGASDHVT
ncbi:hypothetical protein L195_g058292, partial [Trifolium pratense]